MTAEGTYFVIPVYQRNFCWKTEQCRRLFDDVFDCIASGKPHFLGTICYKEEDDGTKVIIDGQQRLTCLSLLLKALYDFSSSQTLRAEIQNRYLLNPCGDGTMKLKLKPIQKDAGIYKKLLSHYRVDIDAFSPMEQESFLFQAFFNFRVWIKELAEIEDFEAKLMNVINGLEIVEIIVTSENPQEIFESLNATGMALTNTDILRNYLLMQIPYRDQVRLYNTYWLPMEELVTTEEVEDFVSSYVVTVRKSDGLTINGKKWKVNPGNICQSFRITFPNLGTTEKLEELFEDMLKYARYYQHLVFEKNVSRNDLSGIRMYIYDLIVTLKHSGFKPLLLYLFNDMAEERLSPDEMCSVLKLMISYVFRSKICGTSAFSSYQFSGFIMTRISEYDGSEPYEKLFSKAISSGHGKYAFPSDIIFEQALMGSAMQSMNTALKKYMLYSIEKEINPSQQVAFSGGTIEHIMPQTLTDYWEKYLAFNGDGDIHDEKLNALGNLTLTESNSSMSNKSFEEKKQYYSESVYEITRAIADIPVWTSKAIDERGKELCRIALSIWSGVKPCMDDYDETQRLTLNDDLVKVTALPPTSFCFLDEEVPVSSWNALGVGVVSILNVVAPEQIRNLVDRCPDEISGLLTSEPDYKKQPNKIAGTIWLNQAKRPSSLMRQLRDLLQLCSGEAHSLCDELWFTVFREDDDLIVMQE